MRSSPNIFHVIRSRIIRWAGQPACMGKRRAPYRDLVGKPEEKRPLSRHRHRLEDNIQMHLKNYDGGVDWINLAQNRDNCWSLVNMVMKIWVP